jgi:hypothetical protein
MKRVLLKPINDNHNIYLIAHQIIELIGISAIQKRLLIDLEKQHDTYYTNLPIVLTFSEKTIKLNSVDTSEIDIVITYLENSNNSDLQEYIEYVLQMLK